MLINRNATVARLQELKGDSTGLVASVFDTCIQAVAEMEAACSETEKAIRGMAKAMSGCKDICDICAHCRELPVIDCEDADCNCSICKADCVCSKCEDGSNFVWRDPDE